MDEEERCLPETVFYEHEVYRIGFQVLQDQLP